VWAELHCESLGGRLVQADTIEQVSGAAGVRQPLDGAVGHAEPALDGLSAAASGQQRVDGGVLARVRSAKRCPVGHGEQPSAGAWTSAFDDLDPWAFGQPGRDRARLAIRQQVNWRRVAASTRTVRGHVPCASRTRRCRPSAGPRLRLRLRLRLRERVDQWQDRVPAGPRPEDVGQPGAGSAGHREASLGQRPPHSFAGECGPSHG
jgi:hypothetical protein